MIHLFYIVIHVLAFIYVNKKRNKKNLILRDENEVLRKERNDFKYKANYYKKQFEDSI